jgi:hypothetical protein
VPARVHQAALRRVEARLWSGRGAHLAGGALDFAQALARYALARYQLARRRGRTVR